MFSRSFLLRSLPLWIIGVCLFLYCGFYLLQERLMLHPVALAQDYHFSFAQPFSEHWLSLPGGTRIHLIHFKTAGQTPRGVVLYFHGNKNNITRYASYASIFTRQGYECWMGDYPGYGKSTGVLSQEVLQSMVLAVYGAAAKEYSPGRILIYGKSLGTGPSCFLAASMPCRELILETPYYSMHELAGRFTPFIPIKELIKMDFEPGSLINGISAPVTIFHGVQDEIIPFTEALRLAGHLKKGDGFYPIPGGRHNNLDTSRIYQTVVTSILNR